MTVSSPGMRSLDQRLRQARRSGRVLSALGVVALSMLGSPLDASAECNGGPKGGPVELEVELVDCVSDDDGAACDVWAPTAKFLYYADGTLEVTLADGSTEIGD